MAGGMWESAGMLLTVLTPLVAVPLTVITFYLRSLREHQVSWHAELVRRVESLEGTATELRRSIADFERDYTTKEEWLRECMQARQALQQLGETTIRIDTALQSGLAGGGQVGRSKQSLIDRSGAVGGYPGTRDERSEDDN
jgi:hypothetical protein